MNQIETCVTCDKNTKNYICDDDPENGTGWFYCEKCWNQKEKALLQIYEDDYQERLMQEMVEF